MAAGTAAPAFRTKPQVAVELVERAVNAPWPLRAVGADACSGETETFPVGLQRLQGGCVLALPPSQAWWRPSDEPGSLQEVATATPWHGPAPPGAWVRGGRHFRDGHTEAWWAREGIARPDGPEKSRRALVATTDPHHLPDTTTWELLTK